MKQLPQFWLSSVLPPGTSYRLEALAPAASFRRFYRVHLKSGSAIFMDAPAPQEDAARFVRLAHRFQRADVPVPDILAHHEPWGYVLMSDLGTRDLQAAYAAGEADEAVHTAIEHLVRVQRIPAGEVPPYTSQRLADELQLFRHWFVEARLGRNMHAKWGAFCQDIVQEIARQPQCVVHRDYHCQNLLLDEAGEFGVVDFQDALAGPALYDLASLLRDCYHRFDEASIARYLALYLEASAFEIAEPARALDVTALQRQLKAIGIFARLALRDGKHTHVQHIAPVLSHASDVTKRLGYAELCSWLNELRGDL